MTPPEHFLYGLTAANTVYAGASLNRAFRGSYILSLAAGSFMAVLPDVDSFTGSYSSQDPFYGHRGWTHSFFAILTATFALLVVCFLFSRLIRVSFQKSSYVVLFLCAALGGLSHLLCDMITPPGIWGGLPLFFPATVRYGGWSYTGWYFITLFWIILITCLGAILSGIIARLTYFFNLILLSRSIWIFSFLLSTGAIFYSCYSISKSRYTDEAGWYSLQMRRVQDFPAPIPAFTNASIKIFLTLYHNFHH